MINDRIWFFHTHIIPSALALLPARMTSREAQAMLLATALQESEFIHRKQVGGPAKGFWQFERAGGVTEILTSKDTVILSLPIVSLLGYKSDAATVYEALQHNDVLATVFARLLLWRDPRKLPSPIEVQKGWDIYLRNWRPGKPRPTDWPDNFNHAWDVVKG